MIINDFDAQPRWPFPKKRLPPIEIEDEEEERVPQPRPHKHNRLFFDLLDHKTKTWLHSDKAENHSYIAFDRSLLVQYIKG